MDSLLMDVASNINGGILTDLRTIFTGIIAIMIVLLGGRLLYSAIASGFSGEDDYVMGITERSEYDQVYDEEEKKDHVNRIRLKARAEIKYYHDGQGA
jgi:hypothetical protein